MYITSSDVLQYTGVTIYDGILHKALMNKSLVLHTYVTVLNITHCRFLVIIYFTLLTKPCYECYNVCTRARVYVRVYSNHIRDVTTKVLLMSRDTKHSSPYL